MRCSRILCLAAGLLFCIAAGAQKRVLDQMPNQKINDFYQDDQGYVWISTDYGICRYNGSDYVNYFHLSSESSSIPSNGVICARQDAQGRLWVLTDEGLCRFDRQTETFISVLSDKGLVGMELSGSDMMCYGQSGFLRVGTDGPSIAINGVDGGIRDVDVCQDSQIWAVSAKDGSVSCYDSRFIKVTTLDPGQTGNVLCIASDDNMLWLGTDHGIRLYDTVLGKFVTDGEVVRQLDYLKSFPIAVIYPYEDKVCICAKNQDIHIYDKHSGKVRRNLALNRYFILSFTSDFSCALYSDGQLWVGTEDRGYDIYSPGEVEFCSGRLIKRMTRGKYFNSMTVSQDSIIWMASRYKGLMSVDPAHDKYIWYKFVDDLQLRKLGTTGLSTVFCDKDGVLWLNMNGKLGLAHVNGLKLGDIRVLDYTLEANAICQDKSGNVWIAAEDGLYRFNGYRQKDVLFEGQQVRDMTFDPDGDVCCYIAGRGVVKISPATLQVTHLYQDLSFTSNLNSLRFNKDGSVWFATRNDGLYVVNADKTVHYGIQTHFKGSDVQSIVFDDNSNAWLGTSYGLFLITDGGERIISYDMNESLLVQQFTPRCVTSMGRYVCLGGVSGIALFSSEDLISKISDSPVDLKIVCLKSQGKVLNDCLRDASAEQFDDLKKVRIPYRNRNLTIEYESVQFYHPEAVKYAYRLKGLEQEWHYVDRGRSASWSYLPSGRYTFELIAMNYDGFWNEIPKTLDITIKPSPFLSWYAVILYIVLLAGGAQISMRYIINRKLHDQKLKMMVESLEQEKNMAKMKVGFFANISHELRTALSLIYGPISMLETSDEDKKRKGIRIIRSNANNLLVLIDQLLNISRIENDSLPLMVSDVDLRPYLNRITASFAALAEDKSIEVTLLNDLPPGIKLTIDVDKFQKILQNLLSNAVKYTEPGGHVIVRVTLTDDMKLRVSVIDDGIGMKPEEAKSVFELYRRLRPVEAGYKGSGIGLYYTKQLVLVHKGVIEAKVRESGGMEFCFELPVSSDAYTSEERQDAPADIIDGLLYVESLENEQVGIDDYSDEDSKPLVAVVEDNPQLRSYLKTILGEDFRVMTAGNASDGLEMISAHMPDVITTDVMMEGMDGYEFCRKVKDDPELSHIPMVMLTAKVAEEDKIAGYKNKANAYITKPFNPELLITVLNNLVEETERMRKAVLAPRHEGEPVEIPMMSEYDRNFLEKLDGLIDEHISEPSMKTSELAEMMGMSRSSLFRKMSALAGVAPNEYVLIYKLNKSVEMLRNLEMNISEVAYALGFTSPSHFSNTFKKRFGVSPKNYIQKQ